MALEAWIVQFIITTEFFFSFYREWYDSRTSHSGMSRMRLEERPPFESHAHVWTRFPMAPPLQQVQSYADGLGWQVSRPFSCKDRDIVAIIPASLHLRFCFPDSPRQRKNHCEGKNRRSCSKASHKRRRYSYEIWLPFAANSRRCAKQDGRWHVGSDEIGGFRSIAGSATIFFLRFSAHRSSYANDRRWAIIAGGRERGVISSKSPSILNHLTDMYPPSSPWRRHDGRTKRKVCLTKFRKCNFVRWRARSCGYSSLYCHISVVY